MRFSQRLSSLRGNGLDNFEIQHSSNSMPIAYCQGKTYQQAFIHGPRRRQIGPALPEVFYNLALALYERMELSHPALCLEELGHTAIT
jgi:hypothetical protein